MKRRTQLKRKTPPKPRRALQRRRSLRKVSPTNKRWNSPGRARPDEPMAETCEAAIPGVCSGGPPTDRHHIIPRGPGSSRVRRLLRIAGRVHARGLRAWDHELARHIELTGSQTESNREGIR